MRIRIVTEGALVLSPPKPLRARPASAIPTP
jgi:hypothetical protein